MQDRLDLNLDNIQLGVLLSGGPDHQQSTNKQMDAVPPPNPDHFWQWFLNSLVSYEFPFIKNPRKKKLRWCQSPTRFAVRLKKGWDGGVSIFFYLFVKWMYSGKKHEHDKPQITINSWYKPFPNKWLYFFLTHITVFAWCLISSCPLSSLPLRPHDFILQGTDRTAASLRHISERFLLAWQCVIVCHQVRFENQYVKSIHKIIKYTVHSVHNMKWKKDN